MRAGEQFNRSWSDPARRWRHPVAIVRFWQQGQAVSSQRKIRHVPSSTQFGGGAPVA
jgi:hypothetical protein